MQPFGVSSAGHGAKGHGSGSKGGSCESSPLPPTPVADTPRHFQIHTPGGIDEPVSDSATSSRGRPPSKVRLSERPGGNGFECPWDRVAFPAKKGTPGTPDQSSKK
eukprot:3257624-Pyramimonas_sp.AAC.1